MYDDALRYQSPDGAEINEMYVQRLTSSTYLVLKICDSGSVSECKDVPWALLEMSLCLQRFGDQLCHCLQLYVNILAL